MQNIIQSTHNPNPALLRIGSLAKDMGVPLKEDSASNLVSTIMIKIGTHIKTKIDTNEALSQQDISGINELITLLNTKAEEVKS
ncbi:MAG: hypothetical protein VW397_04030 [Candidatus Margulisiibacteriota bacterium]